ncbi:hypothetical protein D1BOALGB6SA_8674 [Olavius sp. associated proteobacterium Delta 1]|nr:hypothetical protein D1BOALGB6SA_8674 [Olavius sp. associated proteobacterium Delta 1]
MGRGIFIFFHKTPLIPIIRQSILPFRPQGSGEPESGNSAGITVFPLPDLVRHMLCGNDGMLISSYSFLWLSGKTKLKECNK